MQETLYENFSSEMRAVNLLAIKLAARRNSEYVNTSHVLIASVQLAKPPLFQVYDDLKLSGSKMEELLGPMPSVESAPITPLVAPSVKGAQKRALEFAQKYDVGSIRPIHAVAAILEYGQGQPVRMLIKCGVDPEELRRRVFEIMTGKEPDDMLASIITKSVDNYMLGALQNIKEELYGSIARLIEDRLRTQKDLKKQELLSEVIKSLETAIR